MRVASVGAVCLPHPLQAPQPQQTIQRNSVVHRSSRQLIAVRMKQLQTTHSIYNNIPDVHTVGGQGGGQCSPFCLFSLCVIIWVPLTTKKYNFLPALQSVLWMGFCYLFVRPVDTFSCTALFQSIWPSICDNISFRDY